jgi:hypothetical protein
LSYGTTAMAEHPLDEWGLPPMTLQPGAEDWQVDAALDRMFGRELDLIPFGVQQVLGWDRKAPLQLSREMAAQAEVRQRMEGPPPPAQRDLMSQIYQNTDEAFRNEMRQRPFQAMEARVGTDVVTQALNERANQMELQRSQPPQQPARPVYDPMKQFGQPYDFNLEMAMIPHRGAMLPMWVVPAGVEVLLDKNNRPGGLINQKTGRMFALPKKGGANYRDLPFYKKPE